MSVIAPHDCKICGHEGSLICSWCLPDMCEQVPPRCYRCKKLTRDAAVCSTCRQNSSLKHVWVRSEYDGVAKSLIFDFKFNRIKAAVEPMAKLMAEALPYFSDEVMLVHVPTATSRRRVRGYDHAELLTNAIAKHSNLKSAALLARTGQTRQVGATRKVRHSQLATVFRSQKHYLIEGAHIVLIDDIVTTGATLEAAARILKASGAGRIDALVFAQKQ